MAELIRGMHPELKRKLKAALRSIAEDPALGKALGHELEGLWSHRLGRLRVIYRISARAQAVEPIAIGPRPRIYEETLQLVRRDASG